MEPLDIVFLLNNNLIAFARVLTVLAANPIVDITAESDHRVRILAVGTDWTGRRLEVVAVMEQDRVVVIHAMDARPKLIRLYEEKINDGAP